jgi:FAD/FMN-containing dehydrogenase
MDRAQLHDDLVGALGPAHVLPSPALRDSTGRDIGEPAWIVRPADAAEVVAVVAICRAARAALSPLGSRTAYWSPLALGNTVAIDVSRLRGLEVTDGIIRAGAGWPVRLLDVALRGGGAHLPLHPDAFGNTQLGSLVSASCTSGIGMGGGSLGSHLTGVEWVSGAGTRQWTGAADRAGVPPFMREGLPELTSLILGSEGGLGVLTEVAFRRRGAPWRVRLQGGTRQPRRLFPLPSELAGLYDTFRLQRSTRGGEAWELDVWVVSEFSPDEALLRAERVSSNLVQAGATVRAPLPETAAARRGLSPDYDARWNGPINGLEGFLARASLRGIDVNAPWSAADAVLTVLERLVQAHGAAGLSESRLALYAAPDFVNLGAHATLLPGESWTDADDEPWYEALLELPVVPYRVGRRWPRRAVEALGSRPILAAVKAACDPDGIMSPGAGPWT